MEPRISIVVVTWNVREALERCLTSLDRYADVSHELFVVDNGSMDSTVEFLHGYKPCNQFLVNYGVIYNDRDLGFATAANMGLKRARGEYVLLLNPDTQMLSPSLLKILEVAGARRNLGVLGFKILKPDGRVQRSISELPTLKRQLASRLGLRKLKFDYDRPAEVEQINASAALIPKKILDELGLWDEKFFLWFEENDFCKRVRDAGYKIYYSPEIELMHESQTGIAKMPFWERQFIWQKSMYWYFRKHHGLAKAALVSVLDPLCMAAGMTLQKLRQIKK